MVDASFTVALRQRTTCEENKTIKEAKGNELWNDKPNKKSQKDIDARWTKNGETFYGYKNHAKVDSKRKFTDDYHVTDASIHDSQALEALLSEMNEGLEFFADSAYTGEKQDKIIQEYNLINCVNEKRYRNKPLSEEQKANNKEKSKTRARRTCVWFYGAKYAWSFHKMCWGGKRNRYYWIDEFDIQVVELWANRASSDHNRLKTK